MFSRRPTVSRLSAVALGAAGSALILAGSTGPASAQFFDWFTPRPVVVEPSPAVPAPEIYRRLNGRGYQMNGNMQRNGGVYLADVVDSRGRQQRLVIDAYRGKILQSYLTAPPRPSATVPAGGNFTMVPPPGTYASRDPMAPPPSTVFPGQPQPRMVPGFEPRQHEPRQAEQKPSKKKSKAATRETEPKASRARHPAASPAEATAPPSSPEPTTASVPTSRPSTGSSVPAKAAIAPQAEPAPAPAPAPASTTASSAPVRAPAPAAPAANKPGYANGVPINPLD